MSVQFQFCTEKWRVRGIAGAASAPWSRHPLRQHSPCGQPGRRRRRRRQHYHRRAEGGAFSCPLIYVYLTPAINDGCTRWLRISHASRRAPLQPVPKTQVPYTPYRPPTIAGVLDAPSLYDTGCASSVTAEAGRVCALERVCHIHSRSPESIWCT
jgi:hypothetical protein